MVYFFLVYITTIIMKEIMSKNHLDNDISPALKLKTTIPSINRNDLERKNTFKG